MKYLLFIFLLLTQIATSQIIETKDTSNGAIHDSEDHKVYNLAEVTTKPDFPEGLPAFYKYVSDNFAAPNEKDFNGKVFVTFVVEKDGSLTDIIVLRDAGFDTGKEAVRVLKNSPKWIPGMMDGKAIRVKYTLPIHIVNRN